MGARLGCPARRPEGSKSGQEDEGKEQSQTKDEKEVKDPSKLLTKTVDAKEAEAELRRLEKLPVDDSIREKLREVVGSDLPGRFEGNAFVIEGAAETCRGVLNGTVALFNAEKGYGVIRADSSGNEVFFSREGLAEGTASVAEGDRVSYFEDDEMIEDQVCAVDVKLLAADQ
eukprot:TRINITY_DN10033_c0_g1_i4.p1 TRINITY_DN10033_c0_g1~~TRINITY_DN10033_c0_g1_i4.p1  ORF type:complete len:180 (-),score=53.62 TRINITY_DN10033_c0_g1_i4:157-672(-)